MNTTYVKKATSRSRCLFVLDDGRSGLEMNSLETTSSGFLPWRSWRSRSFKVYSIGLGGAGESFGGAVWSSASNKSFCFFKRRFTIFAALAWARAVEI